MESTQHSETGPLLLADFATRFLWPFYFALGTHQAVATALQSHIFTTRKGRLVPMWEPEGSASHAYRDELLPHARDWLHAAGDGRGCITLGLAAVVEDACFADIDLLLDEQGAKISCGPANGAGVELFLTPQGVGVLSITLAPGSFPLSAADAQAFNYRLAQFQRHTARLRKRHPHDDPARWAEIPKDRRTEIMRATPPLDAEQSGTLPIAERLGCPGTHFTLHEFAGHALRPLHEKPEFEWYEPQQEMAVYTVGRLGKEFDFGDAASRAALAPLISALAQVEEPTHAGAGLGTLSITARVLNRKHWAAACLLGSAHLVADQPAEPGEDEFAFNEQRLRIVRDKYFVPYLLAMIQRWVLNRFAGIAAGIVRNKVASRMAEFESLRQSMLEFGVGGQFSQVSVRQALHHAYVLYREGLGLDEAGATVRTAIGEISSFYAERHAAQSVRQQAEIAASSDRSLKMIAHVQGMVEYIEIFLVSVYAGHLCHMIVPESVFASHLWVAVAAAVGAVVTSRIVLHDAREKRCVILFALIGVLVATGMLATTGHLEWSKSKKQPGPQKSEAH
ncbi:MAG: hypothetical protein ABIP20_16540 [Chthoniobacteraceae bacterium]